MKNVEENEAVGPEGLGFAWESFMGNSGINGGNFHADTWDGVWDSCWDGVREVTKAGASGPCAGP